VNPLDRVALSTPEERAMRAVVLGSALVFLALVPLGGGVFHPVFCAVAVALAVLVALLPESNAALGLVLYLGVLWLLSMPGHLDGWTLAAAVDLYVLHLACTLLSLGPPGHRPDGALLGLWWRRSVLCLGAAVLVWAAARVVAFLHLPPSGAAVGLALVLLLGWLAVLTGRLAGERGRDGPQ
jgi:hypothetical protein